MLGSSSTTMILSFITFSFSATMFVPLNKNASRMNALNFFYGQQDRKFRSAPQFAIDPNFSAMRLHQPLRNCQSQSHAARRAIHANEILKYFLMMFGGNSTARIRHGNS